MPVITTAALTTLVVHLAKKGFEKAFENVGEKVSDKSISWLKSIFTKNGKEVKELEELEKKPESKARQNAARSLIEISLEDNPEAKSHLEEILTKLSSGNTLIQNSKNVNLGNIDSNGGDIQIGDRNGD